MTDGLSIWVTDLRRALERVLDELSERHGDVVRLSADHYWALPPESAYVLTRVPDVDSLTVAQLSDDVAELSSMVQVERDAVPWHDLAHLIGILQRMAALDRPWTGCPGC